MQSATTWRGRLAVTLLASRASMQKLQASTRSRALALATLAAAATTFAAGAQNNDKPTWSLKASTPTAKLVGEWELSNPSGNARSSQLSNAAGMAQVGVTKGSSFQLTVKLVSPAGVVSDVTGSPKLTYRPKGCMSIGVNGIATSVNQLRLFTRIW